MIPQSGTRIRVESTIQEWSGSAVKVPVDESGSIEITPIGEVFKDSVENVGRDEIRV
jgi:hypothetical protein